MFDPSAIIEILQQHQVQFIIIGGLAAVLHGCPEQTYDLDILYADTDDNRQRLISALHLMEAQWDQPLTLAILRSQPVFALNTRHGDLDIMTWIPGVENYDRAIGRTDVFQFGGICVRSLNLQALIDAKEAAADPTPRKQSTLLYLKKLKQFKCGNHTDSHT